MKTPNWKRKTTGSMVIDLKKVSMFLTVAAVGRRNCREALVPARQSDLKAISSTFLRAAFVSIFLSQKIT